MTTPQWTDSELLTEYRNSVYAIAAGQSYSINGRNLTRANLKDVMAIIEWLEQRVLADAGGDRSTLVTFNRA